MRLAPVLEECPGLAGAHRCCPHVTYETRGRLERNQITLTRVHGKREKTLTGEPPGRRWLPWSPWQPGLDSTGIFPAFMGWEIGWFSNNSNFYTPVPLAASESRGPDSESLPATCHRDGPAVPGDGVGPPLGAGRWWLGQIHRRVSASIFCQVLQRESERITGREQEHHVPLCPQGPESCRTENRCF